MNSNFATLSAAGAFGRKPSTSGGLVWGYYGCDDYNDNTIADGTLTLANDSDNYIVVERATGTVSASTATTHSTDPAYARLYKVTTADGLITALIDERWKVNGLFLAPNPTAPGDVSGPGSSTDNALPRFDGTDGKTLQGSGVTVDDNNAIAGYKGLRNAQTGTTYTLQASDTGLLLELTNASAITVTLPNSLAEGFACTLVQGGAGQVSLSAASGATLRNRQSHTKLAGQWSQAALHVRGNAGSAAEYVLCGDTSA